MTESLDRDPLWLLTDVGRLMRTKFDQRARLHGMTRAQWSILGWVNRQPGLSQSELAVICDVEPISIARLVDRLERRGLLERRPDPHDRRIWRLHILPPAQPLLDEIRAFRAELSGRLDAHIGTEAREALVDTLLKVRALVAALQTPPSQAVGASTRKQSAAKRSESDDASKAAAPDASPRHAVSH